MRLEDSVFLTSPNGQAGGNQGLREAVGLDQGSRMYSARARHPFPPVVAIHAEGRRALSPVPGRGGPSPSSPGHWKDCLRKVTLTQPLALCSVLLNDFILFCKLFLQASATIIPQFYFCVCMGGGAHMGHREQVAVRGQPWMLVLITYLCLVHCS